MNHIRTRLGENKVVTSQKHLCRRVEQIFANRNHATSQASENVCGELISVIQWYQTALRILTCWNFGKTLGGKYMDLQLYLFARVWMLM